MSDNHIMKTHYISKVPPLQKIRLKIGLPWKDKVINLTWNRQLAECRSAGIERKLCKDKELTEKYNEKIKEHIEASHAGKLTKEDSEITSRIKNHTPYQVNLFNSV